MSRKIACLFPGQGSQEVGMGRDLFAKDPFTKELAERASDAVGRDLQKICARGPARELAKTENLQPALTVICVGLASRLKGAGLMLTTMTVMLSLPPVSFASSMSRVAISAAVPGLRN